MISQRSVYPWLLAGFMWLAPVSFAQTITGTATYRKRISLPANAVFEATLEDASRADAPAIVIGRSRLKTPGLPPFRFTSTTYHFSIQHDPAQIVAGHTSSVRARVTVDGNLMLSSSHSYPVLTQGRGNAVTMIMQRASGQATTSETLGERSGMFRYLADAATFMDCQTRQRWPVAMEGSYQALEAAHVQMRRGPGEELMATVEGRVQNRPSADGGRPIPTLIVDRYIGVWPGETCGANRATSPLQETHWKLTRIEGKPVIVTPNQPEPNLVFRTEGNLVTGSGGCNNLTGTYTVKGNEIVFSAIAVTRRACITGMDTEGNFFSAIGKVHSWKILGEHLELYDTSGKMVARFEARALR
jgi:heat shock protein HslJ/uncharacterized lipoprotein YbaY